MLKCSLFQSVYCIISGTERDCAMWMMSSVDLLISPDKTTMMDDCECGLNLHVTRHVTFTSVLRCNNLEKANTCRYHKFMSIFNIIIYTQVILLVGILVSCKFQIPEWGAGGSNLIISEYGKSALYEPIDIYL